MKNKLMFKLFDQGKYNALPILLLMAITFITFHDIPTHSFLINWDDQVYVTQNVAIRGFTLENLKTAFSVYYVGNYAPVQIISYMLDYTLWGNNPFGYFVANILYHVISGVLLYFLLIRLGSWKWGAALGTAIFLVHPVQVESVAWLSQRKNLLAMLFYLLSFHSYLVYRERERETSRRWYYLWSVAAFSLALLSKSVAVIFPVMLVMYDQLAVPVRRSVKAHLDKLPYCIAAGVIAVIAMISQESAYGGGRIDYPLNALVVLPFSMLPVLVRYLQLAVWPAPSLQSIMYFPPLRSGIDPMVILSLCVVAVLVGAGMYLYRSNRPCLFWYALFFLGLLPVSQIVPLATMMNDRYLYFPMLGVAGLVAHLCGFIREQAGVKPWGKALLAVSVGIVLSLSYASYLRGQVWRNSISLFSDAVAKYPNQTSTWSRLAEGYAASGDLAMARYYYENASRFGTLDADARHILARIYLLSGEYGKAYEHIWWLLLRGDQSRINLGLLGEYYLRTGSYPEAEQNITSYLEEFPRDTHGLYLLGQVYVKTGNYNLARERFARAVAENSSSSELYYGIACLESLDGQPERSLAALKMAFEKGLSPGNLYEDERCLSAMRGYPLLRAMIRQAVGE